MVRAYRDLALVCCCLGLVAGAPGLARAQDAGVEDGGASDAGDASPVEPGEKGGTP